MTNTAPKSRTRYVRPTTAELERDRDFLDAMARQNGGREGAAEACGVSRCTYVRWYRRGMPPFRRVRLNVPAVQPQVQLRFTPPGVA